MTMWRIKPTEELPPRFRLIEYDDTGKHLLRSFGPVKSRFKAIGMIAKLTRHEASAQAIVERLRPAEKLAAFDRIGNTG